MAGWTDERVTKLIDMWNDGYSASMVAREMSVTRNTVISKVNRLYGKDDRLTRKPGVQPSIKSRKRDVFADESREGDGLLLDLLAMRSQRPPWAWRDMARHFGVTEREVREKHAEISHDFARSEAA